MTYVRRLDDERRQPRPPDDAAAEVSTEQWRQSSPLAVRPCSTRGRRSNPISHIPSAVNVAPKAGVPLSVYVSDVAEIDRLLQGDKQAPLVLYCNGPAFAARAGG